MEVNTKFKKGGAMNLKQNIFWIIYAVIMAIMIALMVWMG